MILSSEVFPSRSRDSAFLTLNRERGKIIFSKMAEQKLKLLPDSRIYFECDSNIEIAISIFKTDNQDGFQIRVSKKDEHSSVYVIYNSSLVTFILRKIGCPGNLVRIRLGEEDNGKIALLTACPIIIK